MESKTGFATSVFYNISENEEEYEYKARDFSLKEAFGQQVLKIRDLPTDDQVKVLLDDIQAKNMRVNLEKRASTMALMDEKETISRRGVAYRSKVNKRREKAAMLIEVDPGVNLTKVARLSGVSYKGVRRIYDQIRLTGSYERFDYTNKHKNEDIDHLDYDLDGISNGFRTVSDLKNRNPSFSRRYILSALHKRGFLWRMVPRAKRIEKQKEPNSMNICHVIRVLSYSHFFDDVTVLFVDEMKLPLFQTPDWHWRRTGQEDPARFNIRPLTQTITAIAMCSIHKFEAVQLYETEVKTVDFTYFLEKAIDQLPFGKKYMVLLDNATWHHGKFIHKSKVAKFLIFNEPRQFRLNLIENAFSYVRALYRRRAVTNDLKEETKSIISIFLGQDCERKFPGFLRNHIRQLKIMFEKHSERVE